MLTTLKRSDWNVMHMYAHMGEHGGPILASPLELGLEVGVSHLMWMLRVLLRSSARAVSAFNC